MIPGADVSAFQGPPADWRTVAGSIDWAGVKMTELSPGGPYRNPDAAADWAALKALGKGRLAYLFGHPGMSISASVDLFLAELDACGLEDGDGAALDLEVTNGLSAAAVASWASDVLALLERNLDRVPLLYTFLSFADAGNCAGLGGYPLWIADPSSPAGQTRIPSPWKTWSLHQFAITGGIDRDTANFRDLTAMKSALGKHHPKPRPKKPKLKREGPMLLNSGAGAVTPVAIPEGVTALRFCAAGTAELSVEFHGQADILAVALSWAGAEGSRIASPPAGCHAARVTRTDAGTGDVDVVAE